MNSLKEALIKEIPVFRELGHKFVNKEVSSGDFKAMSGGMGSYAHTPKLISIKLYHRIILIL